MREKFGIKIPHTTKHALLLDIQNNNTRWADAIAKEMGGLDRLGVFQYFPAGTRRSNDDGWQRAPMQMIFDIKQDGRHKARLVVGGHVIDSKDHVTYSSTIKDISVRLLMLVGIQNGLEFMSGDIGNAFCTAPCAEKVWSVAGPEFGQKEGCTVVLKRALYGLNTASRSFHEFFGDFLRSLGFEPSRADQDLWIRKSEHYNGYEYIATHVDDIIIAAKKPVEIMSQIEQHFKVRDVTDSPSYYLGNDLVRVGNKILISTKKYTAEVLRKYQSIYGDIRKESVPMGAKEHPELDTSPLLKEAEHKQYQHIIGVCRWLIVAGRFDLCYAISFLSRFSAAPREGHLQLAVKVFGYLKKFPKRGYAINPQPLVLGEYEEVSAIMDFGNQYSYFHEDLDPRFPEPLLKELETTIFCDSDHGRDKVT